MKTPRTGLALLGVIALAPAGFVFCTPKAEPVQPEPAAPTWSVVPEKPEPEPEPKPAPESKPVADVASVPAAPATPPKPLRSTKGMSCTALDKAIERDLATRTCTTDADCTAGNRSCGCSVPLSTHAKAQLDADSAAFQARGCDRVGPPRPCASCPMPPEVTCASGACTERTR